MATDKPHLVATYLYGIISTFIAIFITIVINITIDTRGMNIQGNERIGLRLVSVASSVIIKRLEISKM